MIWPSDLVSDPLSSIFQLDWDIVHSEASLMKKWTKTVASWVFTRFFHDLTYWPSFWPNAPIFELDWDNVKMIILSQFDEDLTKTVASRVFTRFFHDLTYWPSLWPNVTHIRTWLRYWPSFWPNVTHIRTWLRYCQDDHSEQVWWRLDQNSGL